MNHKKKIQMARKMRTKEEIKNHTPLFQSKAWEQRNGARFLKELRRFFGISPKKGKEKK